MSADIIDMKVATRFQRLIQKKLDCLNVGTYTELCCFDHVDTFCFSAPKG